MDAQLNTTASMSPTRAGLIEEARFNANLAIAALSTWKAKLEEWRTKPEVSDDEFMEHLQELNRAGLLDWIDGQPIDQLRLAITGVEA